MQNNLEFYATAAQVLPLLFLTLALELRGFVRSPLEPLRKLIESDWPERSERLTTTYARRAVEAAEKERGPLTPEQQFAIDAQARKDIAPVLDDMIQPLEVKARAASVVAAIASLVAMLLLILGEAVTLRVLERGSGGRTESGLVETALWVGGALVAWPLIERYITVLSKDSHWVTSHKGWLTMALTGLVLGATYVAWHSI